LRIDKHEVWDAARHAIVFLADLTVKGV
jgi:hypothetical protein